jgi:hypothetical protein
MTYLSHFSLQQSIYQILANDATLGAMITGVYDHVPAGTEYPFVTVGEGESRDWSNAEKQGTEQLITLRIWSREAGRKQAAGIMERIVTLLHNTMPDVTGQNLISLRFTGSSIVLMNDGTTYRGSLSFRALLSEE